MSTVEDLIPKGFYCYKPASNVKTYKGIPQSDVCPFWAKRFGVDEQSSGYCFYLNRGDWEEDGGTFLLWDMCKECSINKNDEIDNL